MPSEGEIVAYEIEAEGKKIFLTGTFREHPEGDYPKEADLMILANGGSVFIPEKTKDFISRYKPKKILVDHFDNALGVQKKIKKALAYPMLVTIVLVVVVAIMMVKVIPGYMELISVTGAEMPTMTLVVVAISDFMVAYWPIMLGIVVALVIAAINLKKIPACKKQIDKISLKLPIFGDLNKKSIAATFSSTMAMLVESGIPMLQAIEITRNVINNAVADEELEMAINALRQGQSLYDSLNGSMIYPPIMFSMINIGEETGALDDMMAKISTYFKEEVDIAVDNMTMLIEPALTIILAVCVGGLLMAIMMPTFAAASQMM